MKEVLWRCWLDEEKKEETKEEMVGEEEGGGEGEEEMMLNSAVQAIQAVEAVGAMMPNSNSWGNEAEFNDCHRDIVHVCLNGVCE